MTGHAAQRQRRAGGGEHQRHDEQRPQQQQQQVLQLEPALVLPGGGDEIADRGKDDGGRLAPGQQVQEDRDGRRGEPDQHPRVKEADHAARGDGAQSLAQHDAVGGVGGDPVIGDAVAAAGEPPFADDAAHRLPIGAGPVARAEHHGAPGLGILEPRLGRTAQGDLGRIHDVQHQHLVAAVPQKAERLEREVAVEQQVGDEYHQAAPPQLVHHPPERRLGGGALPRLEARPSVASSCRQWLRRARGGRTVRTSSSKVMRPVASRWRSRTSESAAISRWA